VVAGTLIAVNGGTGISSYAQGEMLYANTTTTLDKVTANITTSKKYLSQTGNGTAGLAPTWGDVTATNIAGGTAGTLFYNTAADTTTTLSIGTAYQLLGVNAGATAPSWQGLSSLIDNVFTASAQGTVLYRGASNWVALAPGTNGQFLTSGGTSANVSWTTGGGGGLTGFTAALNTVAPNATNNVSSITASGGTTNQFAAIVPKGTSGFILAVPDSLTAGGNVRGIYSVDLQTKRISAANVASGGNSAILGGEGNTANANYCTVLGGYANTASGDSSVVHGESSIANNKYAAAFGAYATTRNIIGYKAFAPGFPIASAVGINQQGFLVVGIETTNATPTLLVSNGNPTLSTTQLYVPLNSIITFTILVACGLTGAGNAKSWELKGAVKKGATDATNVIVGSVTKNVLAADAGASTWDVAVTANTTTGALSVTATGQASTTIRWTASIFSSEVTY
jgi:hypothetical protein